MHSRTPVSATASGSTTHKLSIIRLAGIVFALFILLFVVTFLRLHFQHDFHFSPIAHSPLAAPKEKDAAAVTAVHDDKDILASSSSVHRNQQQHQKHKTIHNKHKQEEDVPLTNFSFDCFPLPDPEKDEEAGNKNNNQGDDDDQEPKDNRPAYMRAEAMYPVPSVILPQCSVRSLCTRFKAEMEKRKKMKQRGEKNLREWWRDVSRPGGRVLRNDDVQTSARIGIATLMARVPKKKTVKQRAEEEAAAAAAARRRKKNVENNHSSSSSSISAAAASTGEGGGALHDAAHPSALYEDLADDDFIFNKTVSTSYLTGLREEYIEQPWWWRRLHFMSFVNKAMYVLRRRKYDLIVEGIDFIQRSPGARKRNSPAWAKIQVLLKWLAPERGYSWLLWADADSFFTRMTVPLSCFLPRKTPEEMKKRNKEIAEWEEKFLTKQQRVRKVDVNARFRSNLLRPQELIHSDGDNGDDAAKYNDADEFAMYPSDASWARSHAEILMAKDPRGWNDGVFFLRQGDFSRNFLNQMWSVTDAEAGRFGYHDQGAILIITDERNRKSGGHMQAQINRFHMFELEPKYINAYPAPLMNDVPEGKRQQFEFVEGQATVTHFPSAKSYVSSPGWIEYIFGVGMCSAESDGFSTPPPPSVLWRDFNLSIGLSSFRVLGSPLE